MSLATIAPIGNRIPNPIAQKSAWATMYFSNGRRPPEPEEPEGELEPVEGLEVVWGALYDMMPTIRQDSSARETTRRFAEVSPQTTCYVPGRTCGDRFASAAAWI